MVVAAVVAVRDAADSNIVAAVDYFDWVVAVDSVVAVVVVVVDIVVAVSVVDQLCYNMDRCHYYCHYYSDIHDYLHLRLHHYPARKKSTSIN